MTLFIFNNTSVVGTYILESFLYGIYLILFGCTMCLLYNRRQYNIRGSVITIGGALCLLFTLATAHMIISLYLLFCNVLTAPSMSDRFTYYTDDATQLSVVSKGIWVAIISVADSLIAWRGWVLWDRKSWIIPTFVLLEISFIVCAIGHTIASLQSPTLLSPTTTTWYIVLNVTSISTNVLASGLISVRIYQVGRQITRVNGHIRARRYRSLLWIFLESGSICPIVMLTVLALYLSNTPCGWLIVVNYSQIAGMTPTIMILAVLLTGRSLSENTMTSLCTTTNSRSMRTQSLRTLDADQLMAAESLPQLTILESNSKL